MTSYVGANIAIAGQGRALFMNQTEYLDFSDVSPAELSDKTVLIHVLDTRPKYRFFRKMALRVYSSKMLGRTFTTYELAVDRAL